MYKILLYIKGEETLEGMADCKTKELESRVSSVQQPPLRRKKKTVLLAIVFGRWKISVTDVRDYLHMGIGCRSGHAG